MSNDTLKNLKPLISADDAVLDTPATAQQIVKVREVLSVSQKALALEMGVSQAYLCDLEGSRRRWSLRLFNEAKAALERLTK